MALPTPIRLPDGWRDRQGNRAAYEAAVDALRSAPFPIAVQLSPYLRDGKVLVLPTAGMVIGVMPWSEREVDAERIRRHVRHGLADVLDYLGEPVGPHPDDPVPACGGRELLDTLRAETAPRGGTIGL